MTQRTAFLDRDGIINVDHGYVYRVEDFQFVEGFPELALSLKKLGYLLIVITNQSGVARGLYSLGDVHTFHKQISQQLYEAVGVRIDGFYICPHHPKGNVSAFAIECNCRKPKPGLIEKAMADYAIDLSQSFVLGDKDSDVETALIAGITGFQLASEKYQMHPTLNEAFNSLKDFQDFIEKKSNHT